MLLSCYVPSQIIPKSRIVHLADKQILKRHILSYPKIIVSKNPPGRGGGGGGFRYLAHGLHTKSDSLSSPHPRSTTDHILGGETLSAASDQPQPADTTSTASDDDGVAVGEASHADRDEETTNDKGDNATSNTNTRGNPQRNVHVPKTRLRQRSLNSLVTGHGLYVQIGHAGHVLSVKPVSRTLSKECN